MGNKCCSSSGLAAADVTKDHPLKDLDDDIGSTSVETHCSGKSSLLRMSAMSVPFTVTASAPPVGDHYALSLPILSIDEIVSRVSVWIDSSRNRPSFVLTDSHTGLTILSVTSEFPKSNTTFLVSSPVGKTVAKLEKKIFNNYRTVGMDRPWGGFLYSAIKYRNVLRIYRAKVSRDEAVCLENILICQIRNSSIAKEGLSDDTADFDSTDAVILQLLMTVAADNDDNQMTTF